MKKIRFDIKTKNILERISRNPYNKKLYKNKANTLLMLANGHSVNEISKELKLSRRTIYYYIDMCDNRDNTISTLRSFIFQNNYKRLRFSDCKTLAEYCRENPPKSYKEAVAIAKNQFNITISESTVRRYFIRFKVKLKKNNQ